MTVCLKIPNPTFSGDKDCREEQKVPEFVTMETTLAFFFAGVGVRAGLPVLETGAS